MRSGQQHVDDAKIQCQDYNAKIHCARGTMSKAEEKESGEVGELTYGGNEGSLDHSEQRVL